MTVKGRVDQRTQAGLCGCGVIEARCGGGRGWGGYRGGSGGPGGQWGRAPGGRMGVRESSGGGEAFRGTWWQAGPPGGTGYGWLLFNFCVMSRVSLGTTRPGTCIGAPPAGSSLGSGHSGDEDVGSVGDGLDTHSTLCIRDQGEPVRLSGPEPCRAGARWAGKGRPRGCRKGSGGPVARGSGRTTCRSHSPNAVRMLGV